MPTVSGVVGLRRCIRVVLTVVAVTSLVGSCSSAPQDRSTSYCALMPDSVGLYVGNPVTVMGLPIGEVTKLTPGNQAVRVDFTVTGQRDIPAAVKAVIRSTSILADRALELVESDQAGPYLSAGACIPLGQSFTPKSLSAVIGSANTLVKSITPDGSTNVADVVNSVDKAIAGEGADINRLLGTASSVLDSPDRAIDDLGALVDNLAQLTALLRDVRDPLKQVVLDLHTTLPSIVQATKGGSAVLGGTLILVKMISDIEQNLGQTLQFTLDQTSVMLRKGSAHAPALTDLLNPVPSWINIVANHVNDRNLQMIRYRPPLYRIRTPDGVAMCNIMNFSAPGTCANVQGTPYAVDVALLQYVLTEASR